MPRTLLLTTGTSIANGTASLAAYQKQRTFWEDDAADLYEQIRERLKGFDLATEADRVKASAELNILSRLPVLPDDEVVLFSTDTADGRCCAEELKRVIEKGFDIRSVEIQRIHGLQVHDAPILRETGLANLSRRLIQYLDDPQRRYGGGCVLCPNGGFKGVVPFMTVLGMIYRAPVVYVFEFSDAVISLPPLPIGFATDLFERALPALDWAAEQGVFNPEGFYRLIPGFDRSEEEWFQSFLEMEGSQMASLSPLAVVLFERERVSGGVIHISQRAQKDLEALAGPERRDVEIHLRKLASTLWRSQHLDTKYNNDLDFFPRGHNPWRFGGFVENGIFNLCWFARHDEYERQIPLPSSQRAAFAKDAFSEFVPTSVAEPEPLPGDVDGNTTWQELRQQRDQALGDLNALRVEAEQLREGLRKAWKETEGVKKQLEEARSKGSRSK